MINWGMEKLEPLFTFAEKILYFYFLEGTSYISIIEHVYSL